MKKFNEIKNYARKYHKQAGMTLIELTVVLLILIGLAGLLIPYVSGFVSKTHDSTGTNNLAALNGNFARFENEYMRHPDNLESLVHGIAGDGSSPLSSSCAAATVGAVYCNMMNTAGTGFLTAGALNATSLASLNAVGIQTVLDMNPNTANATFESVTGAPRTLGTTAGVDDAIALVRAVDVDGDTTATIEEHLAAAFGGQSTDYDSTCYDYVAFGVGDGSEMVGRTLNSAPIHFAQNGDMAAANRYNRFIAVYRVDKDDTTAGCSVSTEPAKFVGTAMSMGMMAGHLWGVGHSAGHAYENLAATN